MQKFPEYKELREYKAEDLFLLEDNIYPTKEQANFLSKVVRAGPEGLTWYKFTSTDVRFPIFCHPIVDHTHDNDTSTPGVPCSEYSEIALSIIKDFCAKHNIKIKYFLTSNLVNTRPEPGEVMGDIHLDFKDVNYYHFIFYINNVKKGSTYLFDRNKKLIKEVKPVKGKAIIFSATPHAQGFCDKHELRTVLVATFVKED
jgi:hypothetical protein